MRSFFNGFLAQACLFIWLTGCSFSPEITTVDRDSTFDLANYLFHDDLHTPTNELSVNARYYKKSDTNTIALLNTYKFRRTTRSIESLDPTGEFPNVEFIVNSNHIVEYRKDISDSRKFKRYSRIGDVFLNNGFSSVSLDERCQLVDHFNNYFLASATGSVSLSSMRYEDVIKVRCESTLNSGASSRTNYSWNLYYAKGIGLVFKDGDWASNLGEIYAFYEY